MAMEMPPSMDTEQKSNLRVMLKDRTLLLTANAQGRIHATGQQKTGGSNENGRHGVSFPYARLHLNPILVLTPLPQPDCF